MSSIIYNNNSSSDDEGEIPEEEGLVVDAGGRPNTNDNDPLVNRHPGDATIPSHQINNNSNSNNNYTNTKHSLDSTTERTTAAYHSQTTTTTTAASSSAATGTAPLGRTTYALHPVSHGSGTDGTRNNPNTTATNNTSYSALVSLAPTVTTGTTTNDTIGPVSSSGSINNNHHHGGNIHSNHPYAATTRSGYPTTTTTTLSTTPSSLGVVASNGPSAGYHNNSTTTTTGMMHHNNNNNMTNPKLLSPLPPPHRDIIPLPPQHSRNHSVPITTTMERGPLGAVDMTGGGGTSGSSTNHAALNASSSAWPPRGGSGGMPANHHNVPPAALANNNNNNNNRSPYDAPPPGGGGGWPSRGGGSSGGGRGGLYRGGGMGGGGRGGGVGGSGTIQRHSSFGGAQVSSAAAAASSTASSLLGSLPPKNAMNARSQSYGPASSNNISLPSHYRGSSGPPAAPPSSAISSSSSQQQQQQQRPTDPRFRGSQAGYSSSHDAQIPSSSLSSLVASTAPKNSDNYSSVARSNDSNLHNSYRGIGSSQQRNPSLPPSSFEGSASMNNNNSFSSLADPDVTLRRASVNSIGASSGGLDGSDHSSSTIGTYSSIALQRGGMRRGPSEVLEVPIITSSDSTYHRPSIRDSGPFRTNSFRGTNIGEAGPYNRSTSLGPGPSNVRGGPSGPSLPTDSAESTFRGSDYYGPKGFSSNADYSTLRHSPSQRGGGGGRPGFRVGVSGLTTQPLHRESSLPPPASAQHQHRRNDPRFTAMATKSDTPFTSDPQQHHPLDHQRVQPYDVPSYDDASRTSSVGGFERGRYNNDGPAPFRRNSSVVSQQQSINRLTSDNADDFGRSNQWKTSSRPSPTAAPEDRKPLQNFFSTSPGNQVMQPPPPPILSSTASRDMSAEKGNEQSGAHSRSITSTANTGTIAENPPPMMSEKKPNPLLTSALGDENTDRAEKAVAEVECALQIRNAETGCLRKLPSKLQIVQSLKKLDAQIKQFQKDIEVSRLDIEQAEAEEETSRQQAAADAITEAQGEIDRNLEKEKERRRAEEEAHDAEIQLYIKEQTTLYEAEQAKQLSELEAKLKAVKEEEEKKMREALNEQMITTADNFDRDIDQMKKELERATTLTKKTETKLATVENDYREKLVQSGKEDAAEIQTRPLDVVSQILAENRRRAAEAHLLQPTFVSQDEESESDHSVEDLSFVTDPLHGKTTAEWAQLARQVTGPADALYSEPAKAPYFAHNEKMFELIAPIVQEHIRHKQNKLKKRWVELAEEYEYRQSEYMKELRKTENADKPKKAHAVPVRHSILQGGKPNQPIVDSVSGRTSSNPYRRARRGNEVRSEYEQEQIIAEIAAKEAMEKRITFGGSDLPRQICQLERELTCQYINTFNAQRVDLVEQERELALCNVWTDMEKSIFLDRWLQFPKDFKKIASFLRNKTTKDCIQFYYDSKQSVPYKGALREHVMRRKRRGDYNVWTLTIEAALSVGIVVQAGTSEEKPLVFLLPERDDTYNTRLFHPMKREVYDAMIVNEQSAEDYEDEFDEDSKTDVSRKRPREPLFTLDREQSKFLKEATPPPAIKSAAPTHPSVEASDGNVTDDGTKGGSQTPIRKAPQKWTNLEKRMFLETLEKHGKNWAKLAEAVGTKDISQIKNYHYDYKKKKAAKGRADHSDKSVSREDESATPPPELSKPMEYTPVVESQVPYQETTPTEAIHARLPASNYHSLQAQHLQQFQTLHGQQQLHHPQYHPIGSASNIQQSVAHLLHSAENDRSIPHSEASTPDRLDLWAHAHRLQTEEAARHLLLQQHSQQTQQQQILSNLLPWINSGQLSHVAASNLQDQQLQNFLQLQQQQQQQPQNHFNHLAALGLSNLPGMGGLGQQPQRHHHHQQQQQQHHGGGQQNHHRQSSHDAQLVLAQHLLSMQAQRQQGTGSSGAAVDALVLLARAPPDPGRNNNVNRNQGDGSYQG